MFNETFWLQQIYLRLSNKAYNNPDNRIERLLDTVGDGSGTTEQVTGANDYLIAPPAGEVYFLNRINVYIEDGLNEKFSAALYGAAAALSPGIVLTVDNSGGTIALLTPQPVTKIGHWDLVAGIDMLFTDFPSGSSDLAAVRWTFTKGGGPICLIGDNNEILKARVPNLTSGGGGAALVSHIMQVQGLRYRPPKWWSTIFPKEK